jgi:S-adenosylmethionine:tRNA ribosyltransferase-isomerase
MRNKADVRQRIHAPRASHQAIARSAASTPSKRASAHAIDKGYRFYSYGDACLPFRDKST